MGRAARDRGYEYLAICDHTLSVGAVPGLDADGVRRQAEEIAAANEQLAPFRVLRGTECDIRRDGALDLPDDVLAELDWVQASVHGGPARLARGADGARRSRRSTRPYVSCLSHPTGRLSTTGRRTRSTSRRVLARLAEQGRAVEVNGLARPARPPRRARPAGASRPASRSSARPTRTRSAASATWSCRSRPPAAAGARRPTCSTRGRWRKCWPAASAARRRPEPRSTQPAPARARA